ncbi:bifunctional diaminohydroxyphosphoribosylaminopyrimidine deaminase/5-amino-6-(5-phosphoribosylamino)uracil reductase RibD [Aliidiomarina quisquiliarum]|uniref:bifunctional diaminohydroxyphosphoribosylaminopyrimidine deaminase/5-amino-6-(5-phosphoribosylamino)uracil reductase RibD n=1 Tax=Aliidiomarina quisquiliarum TaxID=2938947 RepID=UPI00208E6DFA|nr:bifunctional diaminohydroxyphosphoribosylaminopyrimidine deaminase/5-amino-6-(5-phosphoribosylamino)uracil reductase RibD [Aliidiomarina quisquiliarum]MCO4320225.1 bifunctional diaminohydroxyphosphoribosylaminopyrimidine deaminase/5-amino-6-(5-phosphoribosylamino)uracil reductase RibD [Aliidiomarina quisquiliarum]
MNTILPHDTHHMQRALVLARRGRFTTHPNPNVGCVIINAAGAVVGEGWHVRAGEAHAEVHALRAAGEQARGGTAYVTLEPCSHQGRTPPCADALIAAGLKRVVVAMEDPFAAVSGRGIEKLRNAGIEVFVGVEARAAAKLNKGFMHCCKTGLPLVQVKLAASIDGRTALASGESKWITGPQARADVQLGRALAGAILTGADTVIYDNPRLNVRINEMPPDVFSPAVSKADRCVQQPIRVVIDSLGRVPLNAGIFDDGVPVYLVRTRPLGLNYPAHVQELIVPDRHGKVDLKALLKTLAKMNVHTVWCEAGHQLAGALVGQQLANELWLYIGPKLMGQGAQPMLALPQYDSMAEVPQLHLQEVQPIGHDVKLIYVCKQANTNQGVTRV